MKYLNYTFVAVIVIATISAALVVWTNSTPTPIACTMDAKICPDGSAVGRTGPNCTFAPCPIANTVGADIQAHIDAKSNLIRLTTPMPGTLVHSPLTITGEARGTWYFEASFPISVVDWDGKIIGTDIAQAQGDWMTENFVPFTATVSFTVPTDTPYRRGALILKKDNPSGLPQNDDALEIPVTF